MLLLFLSHDWRGRISDKQLTIESGFFNLLTIGDSVLAERGLFIVEEVATRGAVLAIP